MKYFLVFYVFISTTLALTVQDADAFAFVCPRSTWPEDYNSIVNCQLKCTGRTVC